ncbi:uncharacterized protein BCR38DRAFT_73095 [Pseudomassariella vexata]|uniref:Uncharacterized protein n=1 Tax=Pseudomassariella vexata TaxID=1141098 RepID=A0A1Y2DGS5_9PEZI|nr:uncharacterized protein BCR38DRAFT_73095 [Pseudomassariella vexata]ORY58437.1 hypothetical protein BCR38DRAFT_73095 [Pseudomassariella vexata]
MRLQATTALFDGLTNPRSIFSSTWRDDLKRLFELLSLLDLLGPFVSTTHTPSATLAGIDMILILASSRHHPLRCRWFDVCLQHRSIFSPVQSSTCVGRSLLCCRFSLSTRRRFSRIGGVPLRLSGNWVACEWTSFRPTQSSTRCPDATSTMVQFAPAQLPHLACKYLDWSTDDEHLKRVVVSTYVYYICTLSSRRRRRP